MFFFRKKYKLIETDLFRGLVDHHSHILPGVDDGIKSIDDSLETLRYFEELGVKRVSLTPHVNNATKPSDLDHMQQTFSSLLDQYKGPIALNLAAEYMIDSGFEAHVKRGVKYLSDDRLLVETSYLSAPNNLHDVLYNLSASGETPVIAHPERYLYMGKDDYPLLKDRGYDFQLNILSLSGYYGKLPMERAERMLREGMYDMLGSDLHNLVSFKSWVSNIKLPMNLIEALQKIK